VLEQRSADAAPLVRRVDGDVVDEEALVADPQHDQPGDLAAALGDGHVVAAYDAGVVVGHRPRRPAEALDVVSVGRLDQLGQPRGVRRGRRS
jgi:hypothetical protein